MCRTSANFMLVGCWLALVRLLTLLESCWQMTVERKLDERLTETTSESEDCSRTTRGTSMTCNIYQRLKHYQLNTTLHLYKRHERNRRNEWLNRTLACSLSCGIFRWRGLALTSYSGGNRDDWYNRATVDGWMRCMAKSVCLANHTRLTRFRYFHQITKEWTARLEAKDDFFCE